ncbi:hypothetical protein CXF48_05815 [Corynebacterium bovis]|uniref:Uncharacterized protein n=1 Tax=Corynebacterium bovis TaxID=36808 RepID=A0A3R8PGU1_9CORY|nr:hypothetical protein CXF48_05815 [Corynebacterium bovis]
MLSTFLSPVTVMRYLAVYVSSLLRVADTNSFFTVGTPGVCAYPGFSGEFTGGAFGSGLFGSVGLGGLP